MASSLRTGAPFRHSVRYLPIKSSRNLASPWILHSTASSNISRNGRGIQFQPRALKINCFRPSAITAQQLQLRAYSPSTSLKAPTANNLIEELQVLYVIAKDLFETAADSTDKETIYAASDRESFRDALNQLVTVYQIYTTGERGAEMSGGDGATEAGLPRPVVRTNYDAGSISDTVMGDVRERFGQKVLELKNAVEVLEEKAQDD